MHSVTHFIGRKTITALAVAFAVSAPATATADDIDVYSAQASGQINPNILLILDYSGSMGEDVSGTWTNTYDEKKLTILKRSVKSLMKKYEGSINLGIGSIYDSKPSGVRWPITDLEADPHFTDNNIPEGSTNTKQVIESLLEQRNHDHSTATVNALAEAALYFKGGPVTHNDNALDHAWSHKPDTWDAGAKEYNGGNAYAALPASYLPRDAYRDGGTGLTATCRDYSAYDSTLPNNCESRPIIAGSCIPQGPYPRTSNNDGNVGPAETVPKYDYCTYTVNAGWTQPNYVSPIFAECQKNAIILISDGYPTVRNDGATLSSLLGPKLDTNGDPVKDVNGDIVYKTSDDCENLAMTVFGDATETHGNCGKEILSELANNNQITGNSKSHVNTYTIGFSVQGTGKKYLQELADAGKGDFFEAEDETGLNKAIGAALDGIFEGSANFAELSIDLDKANFSHDNRAYFSLFKPDSTRSWQGNIKGYYLNQSGALVDVNNNEAIVTDPDTGRTSFADAAQSFWSSTADGNDVEVGGANEQMVSGSRNLYTFTGDAIDGIGVDLTNNSHALFKGNGAVTSAMLNNPVDRDAVLDWIQTAPMGDPLHSKVVTATYENGQKVLYTITNQGFLHAIDVSRPNDPSSVDNGGGNELFAFMPQELLKNLPELRDNTAVAGGHIYGLDGQITPIHDDTNKNGIVDDGETYELVFGMRRGGNSYYKINVDTPYLPKLMWHIKGGEGEFANLAQSWSRMALITLSHSIDENKPKKVLVFTGGYDAAAVDNTDGSGKANGNAIYMIGLDGQRLWTAAGGSPSAVVDETVPGMDYSMPSDLVVINIDKDPDADRMYVGDTASNVWRIDLGSHDQKDHKVIHFANLSDSSKGNQPFFYPPSIAMNRTSTGDFLSISMASGNRTDPLDLNSQHAIYMMRDEDIGQANPTPHALITEGGLYNATANNIASADTNVADKAADDLKAEAGWFVNMNIGEKGLSTLLSFEGNIMATTYEPIAADPAGIAEDDFDSACQVQPNGKLYIMDIIDGRPVKYLADGSSQTEGLTAIDRVTPLRGSGIPSSPVVVFPKGSNQVTIMVDKEPVNRLSQSLNTVFWHGQ